MSLATSFLVPGARLLRKPRRLAVLAGAVAAAAALATGAATGGGASNGTTVRTQGGESFVPNGKIMATLKFSPGHLVVTSGETLTFEHADDTQEPHTLSIVNAADVPGTIDDVFNCGAPGTVCDDVFQAVGQALGGEPTSSQFVNISDGSGLDGRLDTLFLLPGDSVSATVTAPSGSTLYFMCVIHAWMQGTITVK